MRAAGEVDGGGGHPAADRRARAVGRLLLGAFLVLAGVAHLTFARQAFQAQVPPWLPGDPDLVVVASGVVEVALGAALVLLGRRRHVVARALLGWLVAGFFVAVLPGNVSQLLTRSDAFGLDTDLARAVRLLFQPALVVWALWACGAWRERQRLVESVPVLRSLPAFRQARRAGAPRGSGAAAADGPAP